MKIASEITSGLLQRVEPFVAADVGGTHARIGLVRIAGHGLVVEHYRKYICADYPGLAAILADFISGLPAHRVEHVVIGLPGYALDGVVINANLPWQVSLAELRIVLGIESISLVNDFEAVAHAMPWIDPAETIAVTEGHGAAIDAPVVVIGPGTGLGAAIRIPDRGRTLVLATEAGQAAFAPTSDLEIEILRLLRRKNSHVSIEQVVSGPGLMNLYAALCALCGETPSLQVPAEISEAALVHEDSAAAQALHVFCGLLGSVVGDLVLIFGAHGGAYLAGGILPQIRGFLLTSSFTQRFLDKGAMRTVLERVPVRLIEHGQLGVIGAASWHLDHRKDANGNTREGFAGPPAML